MSEKEKTNFVNWEKIRGTPGYNEAMVDILFGLLNQSGILYDEGAAAAFEDIENMDDFRLFCNKWDKEGKINPDETIAAAEKIYERTPDEAIEVTDRDREILNEVLRKKGSSEDTISELNKESIQEQKKKKPKIQ